MMGERSVAQASLFYEFRLEDHVPADHLIRAIDGFVDLSGIRTRDLLILGTQRRQDDVAHPGVVLHQGFGDVLDLPAVDLDILRQAAGLCELLGPGRAVLEDAAGKGGHLLAEGSGHRDTSGGARAGFAAGLGGRLPSGAAVATAVIAGSAT